MLTFINGGMRVGVSMVIYSMSGVREQVEEVGGWGVSKHGVV